MEEKNRNKGKKKKQMCRFNLSIGVSDSCGTINVIIQILYSSWLNSEEKSYML